MIKIQGMPMLQMALAVTFNPDSAKRDKASWITMRNKSYYSHGIGVSVHGSVSWDGARVRREFFEPSSGYRAKAAYRSRTFYVT